MGEYSIKELAQLSGIKAHTIRIWEKRYNLIAPQRTDTNIRVYSDEDLKKLLNVTMLYQAGHKISKIAQLRLPEINKAVDHLNNDQSKEIGKIENLIKSMIDLDEELFEKTFNTCVLQMGFENTMMQVIYPFLEKIGILWLNNQIVPAQEHFISNLIRQKIIVAIDGLISTPKSNHRSFILFLPEHEMHELPLMFYHYIIKNAGHRCFYLGAQVPHKDVISMCNDPKIKRPIALTVLTVTSSNKITESYFNPIINGTGSAPLWIAGNVPSKLKKHKKKIQVFSDLNQLKEMV